MKNVWTRAREYVAAVLAGAFGVFWFLQSHGDRSLNPRNVDWLMVGDWSTHLIGWLFFRNEPLRFPLGAVPGLAHPLGTTVGFTDSTPLVALLLRPFAGVLPFPFQYVGLWFVLCFFLQGFVGSRLTALFTSHRVAQLLGGVLFAIAPVLLWRMGHDSLCAHWLVLGLFWVGLRDWPDAPAARRAVALTFLLVGLSATIHPYLSAMTLVLGVAVLVRLRWVDGTLSWRGLGLSVGGLVALLLALFWLFGYLGTGTPSGIEGFGYLSSDLLTFVNPMGWSRLLPTWPTDRVQHEGFGYLGAGVLLLLGLGVGSALWGRWMGRSEWAPQWKRGVPLAVCCLLLAVYALSARITFQGRLVMDLQALYQPAMRFVEPFRSSGRFIWPLHYALLTGALAIVLGSWRRQPWVGIGLLALAVGVQVFDLSEALVRPRFQSQAWNGLRSPDWRRMKDDYRHLVLFPPQLHDGNGRGCPYPGNGAPFSPMFAYQAASLGMTFNSAYLARVDPVAAQAYCTALQQEAERGQIQPDTVYVVHRSYLEPFLRHPESVVCGVLDGHAVCVSSAKESAFRQVLESRPLQAAPLARP
ncbi:DUF6311 domain-containing protein [Vitiosangium sp. GDMCC 1.1324]|uniref:DUF6311 domain-containing protein n=1 Tax=Vitiosangium sp. (strain GDMCC 1.1324) TaxID=2138576 RepID=UPI000D341749|nr:DUF6311 domain-containing protein [Vitiosangium sp. GDMCC 1.1324]PTL79426.1 hypothetical protein DAT35_35135 [Vitiosangium sp. GDMCC 1.1324]